MARLKWDFVVRVVRVYKLKSSAMFAAKGYLSVSNAVLTCFNAESTIAQFSGVTVKGSQRESFAEYNDDLPSAS